MSGASKRPREQAAPASLAEKPPQLSMDGKRAVCIAAVAVAAAVLVYLAIPGVAGLGETWRRMRGADFRWLGWHRVPGPLARRRRIPLPGRPRTARRADPTAPLLPDHNGGIGGNPPALSGRRGRCRPHAMGTGTCGHGKQRGGRTDGGVPGRIRRVRRRPHYLRCRPAYRRLPRPGFLGSDHSARSGRCDDHRRDRLTRRISRAPAPAHEAIRPPGIAVGAASDQGVRRRRPECTRR
jgi:hypothetical protein